ncbi:MAG: hypothetical protein ABI127_04395 [Dokdonella sp.]
MNEPTKLSRLLLFSLAVALAGCGNSDPQQPTATAPTADSKPVQTATPAPAAKAATSDVSRERVLRAITCQNVLSQAIGTKMANADTGLPPDLEARLKVSAAAPWDTFAVEHAPAAGIKNEDRPALIVSLNKPSRTAEDRQHTVDIVRDCLDNEP